jgi:hypothetical protein
MMYAFPILIAAMLGYMFWHAGFSMRRDRILHERSRRRLFFLPIRARNRLRR